MQNSPILDTIGGIIWGASPVVFLHSITEHNEMSVVIPDNYMNKMDNMDNLANNRFVEGGLSNPFSRFKQQACDVVFPHTLYKGQNLIIVLRFPIFNDYFVHL